MRLPLTAMLLPALALAAWLSAVADAQPQPAGAGLGQAFPPTANLSSDPLWRVYVLQRDGVRYYQINDASGGIHAAFAVQNDTALILPLGVDADRISVSQAATDPDSPETVIYKNPQLSIAIATEQAGSPLWSIAVQLQTTANQQDAPKSQPQFKSQMTCHLGCGGSRIQRN